MLLDRLGLFAKLFIKGDDTRIVIMIPPELLEIETVDEIRTRIVTMLKEGLESLGHKMNINESYGSVRYFAFSKIASVGQVEMPDGIRNIQKYYGANNAFLSLLDDYIGTAFSTH